EPRLRRNPCRRAVASPWRYGSGTPRSGRSPVGAARTGHRARKRSRDTRPFSSPLEGEAEHAVDGARRALPVGDLTLELLETLAGDRVIPRTAIVVAGAPFGADPSAAEHPLQGRIERTLVDVEDVAGDLAKTDRESPPVH